MTGLLSARTGCRSHWTAWSTYTGMDRGQVPIMAFDAANSFLLRIIRASHLQICPSDSNTKAPFCLASTPHWMSRVRRWALRVLIALRALRPRQFPRHSSSASVFLTSFPEWTASFHLPSRKSEIESTWIGIVYIIQWCMMHRRAHYTHTPGLNVNAWTRGERAVLLPSRKFVIYGCRSGNPVGL